MRVQLLDKNPLIYSCNVYYIRGDWNAIDDVNTLIDVGTDGFVLKQLNDMTSTGVGKRKVEQVIITHEHFDHAGGLKAVKGVYNPTVIAYQNLQYVDKHAYEGMEVKIGNCKGVIFHTPGHSHDSICIYVEQEATLFAGDTPLNIRTPGGSYNASFVEVLKRFNTLNIKKIYSGHDDPITENVAEMLENTLRNVLKSKIIP